MIRTQIGGCGGVRHLWHRLSGRLHFPGADRPRLLQLAPYGIYRDFAGPVERSIEGFGIRRPLIYSKADGGSDAAFGLKGASGGNILSWAAASVMESWPCVG
jgi:hypothetical protein